MRRAAAVPAVVAGAGAACLGYAAGVERNAYVLRRYDVPVLAPGTRQLRVLHVSDVHLMPGQRRKRRWLRSLAELRPDLVVTTGDNLGGTQSVPATVETFAAFAGVPAVFVLGSNDYYAATLKNPLKYLFPGHKRVAGVPNPWRDLVAGLTSLGWCDLTNRRVRLDVGGRVVDVVGVDDPHLRRDDADVAAAPADSAADVRIALVHAPEPRVLDRYAAGGWQLVLAGHTHGGQLRLPGYGAIVTNCGLDRPRARGLSRYGAAWLHVSAGLGTSPYAPVRFACRPEATLLTLVAATE